MQVRMRPTRPGWRGHLRRTDDDMCGCWGPDLRGRTNARTSSVAVSSRSRGRDLVEGLGATRTRTGPAGCGSLKKVGGGDIWRNSGRPWISRAEGTRQEGARLAEHPVRVASQGDINGRRVQAEGGWGLGRGELRRMGQVARRVGPRQASPGTTAGKVQMPGPAVTVTASIQGQDPGRRKAPRMAQLCEMK